MRSPTGKAGLFGCWSSAAEEFAFVCEFVARLRKRLRSGHGRSFESGRHLYLAGFSSDLILLRKMSQPPPNTEITFQYSECEGFRTSHVDGVLGGGTPQGNVYLAFYLERAENPESETIKVLQNGNLGDLVRRKGTFGVRRELQTAIILNVPTAKALVQFINDKITELEIRQVAPPVINPNPERK
jgi:hypothetical protein